MKNKILKVIGNILVIVAVIFVFRKLLSYDIDYSTIFTLKNLVIITIMTILYGINVYLCSFPWFNLATAITNTQLCFSEVAVIFTKSGLLKYIPGNILQYVGRNELALQYDLNHAKVALSTFLDVVCNLCAIAAIIICFSQKDIVRIINLYHINIKVVFAAAAIGIFFAIIVSLYIYNKNSLHKVTKAISKAFILDILFYVITNLFASALFIIIMKVIANESSFSYGTVIGAFLLSWVVGFIVPGAPGGIGIREAIITFLLSKSVQQESVVISIIIYRFITTIGDLVGFIIAILFKKQSSPCKNIIRIKRRS